MIRSKRISAFLTTGVVQYLKFASTLFADVKLSFLLNEVQVWVGNLSKISIMTFQHIVIEMIEEEMILFLL